MGELLCGTYRHDTNSLSVLINHFSRGEKTNVNLIIPSVCTHSIAFRDIYRQLLLVIYSFISYKHQSF